MSLEWLCSHVHGFFNHIESFSSGETIKLIDPYLPPTLAGEDQGEEDKLGERSEYIDSNSMPFKPLLDSRTHRRMADQGGATETEMIAILRDGMSAGLRRGRLQDFSRQPLAWQVESR